MGGAVILLLLLFILTMGESTSMYRPAKENIDTQAAVTAAAVPVSEPPNYETNPMKRVVIAAHYQEDTAWLNELSKISPIMLMGPAGLPANKGGEGMAYLTYIINHYDHLPESMLFIHGHEEGWHTEGPQVRRIMEIPCWNEVPYASITTYPYEGSAFILNGNIHPALLQQQGYTIDAWKNTPNFEKLLNMSMPDALETPCCAQFMVHRKRVLARSKDVYEKIRQWLIDTEVETYFSGRVMEYTWHVSGWISLPVCVCVSVCLPACPCSCSSTHTSIHSSQVLFGDPPFTKHLDVEVLQAKCPVDRDELTRKKQRRNRWLARTRKSRMLSAIEGLLDAGGFHDHEGDEEEEVGVQLYRLE